MAVGVVLAAGAFAQTAVAQPSATCPDNNPLRNLYFGDLHVHTKYSHDAYGFGTRNGPAEAYRFAQGEPIGLPPLSVNGTATRTVQLAPGRELDFAAVTDHAEYLGPLQLCTVPGLQGFWGLRCILFRLIDWPFQQGVLGNVCTEFPGACNAATTDVWQSIVDDAEDFNAPCAFTTFPGYEWTGARREGLFNLFLASFHRNVLFRSAEVPDEAVAATDVTTPEGLWSELVDGCLERSDIDCDAVVIPHTSGQSRGWMFAPVNSAGSPLTAPLAQLRADLEPLVEITQIKGTAECAVGVGNTDEDCAFEEIDNDFWPLSFVREGLKEGLRQQSRIGVNPFAVGLIGSTDTHNATPGMVEEGDNQGWAGKYDATPADRLRYDFFVRYGPGGLVGAWATENTRDALFDAVQRREVFATSGPRIAVRLFSGFDYPLDLCDVATDQALSQAYSDGVPMGGDFGPPGEPSAKPRFFASALSDPGTALDPGAPLEVIQIIKGWYDGTQLREQVVPVVESPNVGPDVDPLDCEVPANTGSSSLCTVWQDDSFNPSHSAFYYARVLEVPTCRWHTRQCRALGVNCSQPGTVPSSLQFCCGIMPQTIQERAWSSPVWYQPATAP